jgi:NAD(P)H-hydrate epimerase
MTTTTTTSMTGYLNAADAAALDVELMSPDIGGYTLEQLMELAGMAVAEAVMEVVPSISPPHLAVESLSTTNQNDDKIKKTKKKILVLCGPGNNGGDGLVAARHLYFLGGYDCTVVYPKRSTKQPHYNHLIKQCENVGIPVVYGIPDGTSMGDYDVIIDALFGFSFHGEPREPFATMLQQVMEAQRSSDNTNPPVVISVDVPSGWNVDEGDVNNSGFVPDVLVSLTTPKLCSQKFTTGRHFVGGRFLPQDFAARYNVKMPPYPGISQVMEVPVIVDDTKEGEKARINNKITDHDESDGSWREEYAAYLAEQNQADNTASTIAADPSSKIRSNVEEFSDVDIEKKERWEDEYTAYCAEKEAKLAAEDARYREALRRQD